MANHIEWSSDIETVLIKLRLNSLLRSKYHKASFEYMANLLKYFRIPVIVLSSLSSVFNVALQNLMDYRTSSLICCFISLSVGLIGSIELFLQIEKRKEIDLHNSKNYELIANDITKMLTLKPENRSIDGKQFLEDTMNKYNSLCDLSTVGDKVLHNRLLELNIISNISEEEELKIFRSQKSWNPYKTLLDLHRNSFQNTPPNSPTQTDGDRTPRDNLFRLQI